MAGQFYVTNFGDTDATISSAYFIMLIAKTPLPMERPYEGLGGNLTIQQTKISPGESHTLAFDFPLATIGFGRGQNVDWKSEGKLYALGWVEYADGRKVSRRTTFCRKFSVTTRRFAVLDKADPDYETEE